MGRVVVGIIRKLIDGKPAYLLVASKGSFGKFTGHYYPPGGHVEGDEDDISCLRRELFEELRLELVRATLLCETDADVPGQTTAWYECGVASFEFQTDAAEIADARYCTKGELTGMPLWPATERFFNWYFAKHPSPDVVRNP